MVNLGATQIIIQGPSVLEQAAVAVGAAVLGGAGGGLVGARISARASREALHESARLAEHARLQEREEQRRSALTALMGELLINAAIVTEVGSCVLSRVALDQSLPYIPSLPDQVAGWVQQSNLKLALYNGLIAELSQYYANIGELGTYVQSMEDARNRLNALAHEAANVFLHARNELSKLLYGKVAT